MNCQHCNEVERSCTSNPFIIPNRSKLHQCPFCFQCWYCYNDYYFLWGRVNDELTWKFLKRGVDVPLAIGSICQILPGYEQYAIDPVHEICAQEVARPPIQPTKEGKVFLQWLGDYRPSNLLRYQFLFPILFPTAKYPNSTSFMIPFVGRIRDWPNENERNGLAKTFNNEEEDGYVVYLISAVYPQKYANGIMGLSSFITKIVSLGDPNVGLITPEYFADFTIANYVIEEFRENNPT